MQEEKSWSAVQKEGKTTIYFYAIIPLEFKNLKTNPSKFYFKLLNS